MFGWDVFGRHNSRRSAIREGRPDAGAMARKLRERGVIPSLGIAAAFCIVLIWIFLMREDVIGYRPGQYVPHDITSRVDFKFFDSDLRNRAVDAARDNAPRVYRPAPEDAWSTLQLELLALPDKVHGLKPQQLEGPLKGMLDATALAQLDVDRAGLARQQYEQAVKQFIADARLHLGLDGRPLVVLPQSDWASDADAHRPIVLAPALEEPEGSHAIPAAPERQIDAAIEAVGSDLPDWVLARLEDDAQGFDGQLGQRIARLAAANLADNPNYLLDEVATTQRRNEAADHIDQKSGYRAYVRDVTIVPGGRNLTDRDWQLLRTENQAYHDAITADPWKLWEYRLGLSLIALAMTVILSAYVARYQPRCVRNHARGIAMAALLLSMLLVTELAGIGNTNLYFFGLAPTIMAAMILTIAYEQRFALGVATVQSLIVTAALNQGLPFFLILWVGVLTSCYLLGDVRTRSKLVEVGGVVAVVMMIVTVAVEAADTDPFRDIANNCLLAGAAALAAGVITLAILPFIEKAFRITTSMTLLELADVSQPLLRRLSMEAPGTYSHSLQVATLAEAAAESIGANSLLCRVGAYYHDVGKINKPDYFVENQQGGENRHLHLSPSLSLRIIISHVKDGVEMAKEYKLPTSILPIIQQHHGTTVVEFFYYQAMREEKDPDEGPQLSETEFRYPGPKPKSRESAILMLADAVESACRAMVEPTPSRIESLVHDLSIKRLHDGQFDECDLTMRDLEMIQRSLTKTLLGIYHGRVAYPTAEQEPKSPPPSTVKSA